MDPHLHGRNPEELLRLPCSACGGQLVYSAEKQQLHCKKCGHTENFARANDRIVEIDLENFSRQAVHFTPQSVSKKVVECQSCRSQLMVGLQDVAVRCNFCGSTKVNEKAYSQNLIQPQGLIPFLVPKEKAVNGFRSWIKEGWFRPNKLKELANLGDVHGIYVPFWTFDAQTYTEWQGEAGYYYYETERVLENGQYVDKEVRRTRWEWRRGDFNRFFNDVLIVASKGLPEDVIKVIYPYRLNEVINFNPSLLLGWEAEIYSVDVEGGYKKASRYMDEHLRTQASQALGGDTQRGLQVDIEKYERTFKHIVLPVWLCTYQYNGKTYRFAVNGQTGTINGEKPYSAWKIFFFILFIAAVVGLLVFLSSNDL